MHSWNDAELILIGQYLNIFVGTFMLFCGLFGGVMNIWLFNLPKFQMSSCSRYIVASSLFDMMHLIFALVFRILREGFQIDPSSMFGLTCSIRYYL